MKFTKLTSGIVLVVSVLIAASLACRLPIQQTGPVETKTETVELGAAEAATVEINMGAGQLAVAGGAGDLLEAAFTYNIAAWEPEVDYSVSGGLGELTIEQPESELVGIPDGDIRYEWDLRLNDDIPLNLDINLGAGESRLDLRSLTVGNLAMSSGAGQVEALLGGSQLTDASISAGVGETTLDLTGQWDADVTISIAAGVGDLTVIVPSEVGAIVDVEVGIGNVSADGFRLRGGAYTNDAYENSTVTLQVDIDGGIGQITLLVSE